MNPREENIVFFDVYCTFCSQGARLGHSLDSQGQLKWASLQGETARKLLPENLREEMTTLVFYRRGKIFVEAEAIFLIAREFKAPWKWAALLRFLPKKFTASLYRLLARHRHRLGGRTLPCPIPTESEKKNFLD